MLTSGLHTTLTNGLQKSPPESSHPRGTVSWQNGRMKKRTRRQLAEQILGLGGTLPYGIEKLHDMANCKAVNYPKDMKDLKGIQKRSSRLKAAP